MKKLSLLILSLILVISFSGCQSKIEEARTEANEALNATTQQFKETKEDLENTIDKIEETIDDTKIATEKIKEAKDAVDAITE